MSKDILLVKAPDITDTYVKDEDFEKELEKISLDSICNSNQTKILKIHDLDESNYFDCIAKIMISWLIVN
jgi:hypothetical protein